MEQSILKSTKKLAGLSEDNTVFDLEILTDINAAFSSLSQVGIGNGAPIEDDRAQWSSLELPVEQLNLVKTYISDKVRLAFDPPGTSFLIQILKDRIQEQEWRLNVFAEADRVISEVEEEVDV